MWGTLIEGVGGVDAIASLDHPERPLVGMPLSTRLQAFIDPSGSVVYFDGVVFRKFVPVPFSYATPWQYPANPTANSPVIGTCPTSIFCDGGFQMQQDTGALIARTSAGWVDLQGRMLVTTSGSVLAWNSAGYFLVYNLDGLDAYGISVRDPQGRDFPVTAFGPHAFASLFPHARAHGSDFWIVFQTSTTERSLWTIAANGTATKTGDYAPYDKPISQRFDAALAADGSFWNVLTRQNPVGSPHYVDDYIVRLPLVPGTPTVVYDEGTFPVPPPSGANNAPPRAWYHSSFLFTSP